VSSARRPIIAGNWKMHKTVAEARVLVRALRAAVLPGDVDVVVAPPFTALGAVHEELHGSHIRLGAQTMHEDKHGAYTGEISPVMLAELGVRYVILGHSERRAHCGETDEGVNRKVKSALAHGLTPIVAVGESRAEHEAGLTCAKVTRQTRAAFAGVEPSVVAGCIVAYEPIWAIGTGLVDQPENANAVMGEIRAAVDGLQDARLLYGGSMKAENAPALIVQPHIDGGLIGGASLNAESFLAVVHAASAHLQAL
jgi:triosephosphate isomerase